MQRRSSVLALVGFVLFFCGPSLCFGQDGAEDERLVFTAELEVSGYSVEDIGNLYTEEEEAVRIDALRASYPLGQRISVRMEAAVANADEISADRWLLDGTRLVARANGQEILGLNNPVLTLTSSPGANGQVDFLVRFWAASADFAGMVFEFSGVTGSLEGEGLAKAGGLSTADPFPAAVADQLTNQFSFQFDFLGALDVVTLRMLQARTEYSAPEPPPEESSTQIILDPNGPAAWRQFGSSTLAVDEEWMAVGQRGVGVHLYELNVEGTYEYRQLLGCPDGEPYCQLGSSLGNNVAIDLPYMLVGAPTVRNDDGVYTGAAYLYELDAEGWAPVTRIDPPGGANFDSFGESVDVYVDIDANRVMLLAGATGSDLNGPNSGAAYLFSYDLDGGLITMLSRILPQDGGGLSDRFGSRVALNKTRYAVSSWRAKDAAGIKGGAVYVGSVDGIEANATTESKLVLGSEAQVSNARFGYALDISDEFLVVGGYLARNENLARAGAVYVYDLSTEDLADLAVTKLTPSETGFVLNNYFGKSVAIAEDLILTSSYPNDTFGANWVGIGHMYAHDFQSGWTELPTRKPSEFNDYMGYGYRVGIGYKLGLEQAVFSAFRYSVGDLRFAGALFSEPITRKPRSAKIVLNYGFDDNGFFSDPVEGPFRRAQVEWAARRVSGYLRDQLDEIRPNPAEGREWSAVIASPAFSPEVVGEVGTLFLVPNAFIPKNNIVVFVGGAEFTGPFANSAGAAMALPESYNFFNLEPDEDWANAVNHRGQTGMDTVPRTDSSVWGRSVTFNTNIDWLDNDGTWEADERSLYRTAMHEFIHCLGFLPVDPEISAYGNYYDASTPPVFTGPLATLSNNGTPPEMANVAHLGSDLSSNIGLSLSSPLQSVLMRPRSPNGPPHDFPTLLDLAVLADIGWEIDIPVQPEPEPLFLQGGGGAFPNISIPKDQVRRAKGRLPFQAGTGAKLLSPNAKLIDDITISDCSDCVHGH